MIQYAFGMAVDVRAMYMAGIAVWTAPPNAGAMGVCVRRVAQQ